jgi:hypothetical protein
MIPASAAGGCPIEISMTSGGLILPGLRLELQRIRTSRVPPNRPSRLSLARGQFDWGAAPSRREPGASSRDGPTRFSAQLAEARRATTGHRAHPRGGRTRPTSSADSKAPSREQSAVGSVLCAGPAYRPPVDLSPTPANRAAHSSLSEPWTGGDRHLAPGNDPDAVFGNAIPPAERAPTTALFTVDAKRAAPRCSAEASRQASRPPAPARTDGTPSTGFRPCRRRCASISPSESDRRPVGRTVVAPKAGTRDAVGGCGECA